MNKKVIHSVFENTVQEKRNNIAVETESKNVSYEELNIQANRIAHVLANLEIQKGDIVATFFDDVLTQLFSLLGVFKSAAIYLPLDKKYKQNHWEELFTSIKPKVILISEENFEVLKQYSAVYEYSIPSVVIVSQDLLGEVGVSVFRYLNNDYIKDINVPALQTSNPEISIDGNDASYIYFTSGSTGRPKAVLGNHKSLSHFIHWESKELSITEKDRIGQLTSFSFDASLRDVFVTLMNGGTLCIPSKEVKENIQKLSDWIAHKKITVLHTIPTMMRLLISGNTENREQQNIKYPTLKYLLLAGEKLYNRDITNWRSSFGNNTTIINLYGATESTLVKTFYKVKENLVGKPSDVLSVGKPISNTGILIVNTKQEICEVDEVGEVFIKTPFLSKGYFNNEIQTADKFVQNPLSSEKDIIYKTGDYGKYDIDRNITILGRNDGVVKNNGVRIDLNYIESVILSVDDIQMVKCFLVEKTNSETILYTCYTSLVDKTDALRAFCSKRLSNYEMPGIFMHFDEFPINSNGKVDVNALKSEAAYFKGSTGEICEPTNDLEKELVTIWKNILSIKSVSIKDNFLYLGGDSIKLIKLKSQIHKIFEVAISLNDLFDNPILEQQASLIKDAKKSYYSDINNAPIQDSYPLSFAQNRLWIQSQFEKASVAYNMPSQVYINDYCNIDNLEKAIISTINRHEALRTVFRESNDGTIRQWILPSENIDFKLQYEDFRTFNDPEYQAAKYINEDAYLPFDLENGPLLRASLLQIQENQYIFYYNIHHIVSDGWSMGVLTKDIITFYESLSEGVEPNLPVLRVQYKDYTVWQLSQDENIEYKQSKAYWLDTLSGDLPLLDLPISMSRPNITTYNGHNLSTYISSDITRKLKSFSNQNGGSLFMGLLTVWNILVYKYTSDEDVIIGTPSAGRDHADLENQIGFYINTLALRNKINPEESFEYHFNTVKDSTVAAFSNQLYPFDRLVEELELTRDTSRNPVFDVMLILQNRGELEDKVVLKKDMINKIVDHGASTSKFDMSVNFQEVGECLSFHINYNTDIYKKDSIEVLMAHFSRLLDSILENPQLKIEKLDYLSVEEYQQVLTDFNATAVSYPANVNVLDYFREQVVKNPQREAVVFENQSLSFQELDERSNQLANFLVKKGVIKGNHVPLCIDRSLDMIVSILSILKVGGVYVPIDTSLPTERISYILEDINASLVLTTTLYANNFKGYDFVEIILIDLFKSQEGNDTPLFVENSSLEDIAYIMYTSGTTGKPKGVLNTYKGLLNRLFWMRDELQITSEDSILQKTTYTFDVSVWELMMPLVTGCKLVFAIPEGHKDPLYLQETILKEKITILHFVPSMLEMFLEMLLPEYCNSLKHVVCSGEALSSGTVDTFQAKLAQVNIHNYYGPTEAAIDVTSIDLTNINTKKEGVSIGKPVANTQLYVVNKAMKLQPLGVVGELLIGGVQLSKGYLNRPDLTKEKFVKSPFIENELLYKTGDLAKWLPDGSLEYVGRKDNQVKIRGQRIELGEIEQTILSNPSISQAAAVVKEVGGDKNIVVYFVPTNDIGKKELKEILSQKLPNHMVPHYYVVVDSIALTSNGKLDRKSLPAVREEDLLKEDYVAPQTDLEKQLASLWEDILGCEQVGLRDDFFALGGHSIKATRLINEYQKIFSSKLTLKEIFENPSLCSHAELILNAEKSEYVKIQPVKEAESYPLSSSQLRLWVLSQFKEASVAYNIPNSIVLNGDYDISIFTESINLVIDRHEILRTIFKEDNQGKVRQWVLTREELGFSIDYQDFRDEDNIETAVQDYINEDSYKAFDLSEGPLLRASLLQVSEDNYVFYYNMHHIISDGWSMEVLTKDILTYCNAFNTGKSPDFKELEIQYKDYASWEQAQLNSDGFDIHKQYWLDQLSGELPVLNLPSKKVRPKVKTHNGNRLYTYLSKELTKGIKDFGKENGGSVFMTLLATWNVLLQKYTSSRDIILGTPVAGRNHGDLENQIGFYVNSLVLRNKVYPEHNFIHHYEEVKKSTLSAFSHQMYPFDRLVEELDLVRDTSRNPVFDVMLILQNNEELEEDIELQEDVINKVIDQGSYMTKFDMSINFKEAGDYLYFDITYNKDLYDKELVKALMKHYIQLVPKVLSNTLEIIGEITYLNKDEEDIILNTYNDTKIDFPENGTLVNLFRDQVFKTPKQTALVFGNRKMSYQELDSVSNQFSNYLKTTYAIGRGDLISLKLARSEWNVIAILGILKSGAAYIPIDPEYPQDRISYIESDSQSKLSVDEVLLEEFLKNQALYTSDETGTAPVTNDLAYVIYTSGSTGKPKGVMIEHGNIVNTILSQIEVFDLQESDHSLQFASFSFDASVSEIFITLLSGASLFIADDKMRSDPRLLESYIIDQEISIATLPPSYLRLMDVENLKGMRGLVTAGEAPANDKVSEFLQYGTFYNAYGPTETSICGSVFTIPKGSILNTTTIPIGYPIANTQIYILDEFNNLQPEGVLGEICIGGKGLAREYLNKPELTNEKFIKNPFGVGKLYKTGDLGTWLPDGSIEFLGRLDDQIKINGYRVELNEIGQSLENHSGIDEALVLIKENENNVKELVAYFKKKQRVQLTPSLSEYLVYDDLLYRALTSDEKRNDIYKNAFQKVLKDKVVLDIGTGKDAILSRFCIEAGAKKVYAVEILEESYNKAKANIENLKLSDKIILIHGDITKVELPEKVDYCISEIVGSIGGSEGASILINEARRLLKDPKNMLPERSLTKIAGVHFPESLHEFLFDEVSNHYVEKIFDQVGYNFDFRVCVENFPVNNIITNEEAFEDLNFTENVPLEEIHTVTLNFNKDSSISGFLVWLYLLVDEDSIIDTLEDKYVWKPVYLPVFDTEIDVQVGDYIEMTIDRRLSENKINPDFLISGKLVTKDKKIDFDYKTGNHSNIYKGNAFYEKLFQNEKLRTQNSLNTSDLRSHLKETLPEYMLPSHYVEVENFQITVNGKIDKEALPDPYNSGLDSGIEYVAPDNDIEERLVKIWEKYLNREKIGVNDNFFHIGGDSIKGVRIMSEIQKEFTVKIDIETLFHNATIRKVSEEIANQTWCLRETKEKDVVDKILI